MKMTDVLEKLIFTATGWKLPQEAIQSLVETGYYAEEEEWSNEWVGYTTWIYSIWFEEEEVSEGSNVRYLWMLGWSYETSDKFQVENGSTVLTEIIIPNL